MLRGYQFSLDVLCVHLVVETDSAVPLLWDYHMRSLELIANLN